MFSNVNIGDDLSESDLNNILKEFMKQTILKMFQ